MTTLARISFKSFVLLIVLAWILPECSGHWNWLFGRRRRRRRSTPPVQSRDCLTSAWSQWSVCDAICDQGIQTRTRTVTQQPRGSGNPCPSLWDSKDCGTHNGGCEYDCNYRNGKTICSCPRNHVLRSDNTSCMFVDPCSSNGGRGPCAQICRPRPYSRNGYVCRCRQGYQLNRDGKTCSPEDCHDPRFPRCPWDSYSDVFGTVCKRISVDCPSGTKFNDQCTLKCPVGFAVAKITSRRSPFAKTFSSAQFNIPQTIACNISSSSQPIWTNEVNFGSMFCRRTNDPPELISLSNNTILEHSRIGTVVGQLSAVDPQQSQSIVFTLEDSPGFKLFMINGNNLVNKWVPSDNDLQGQQTVKYRIKIRATDNDKQKPMFISRNFIIDVVNVNDPPHSIQISHQSVLDTATPNTLVGTLSAIDDDGPHKKTRNSDFVWKMVNNGGGKFGLLGAKVIVASSLNSASKNFESVIVQCTDKDPTNPKTSKPTTIVINVIDVNDSPKSLQFLGSSLYENASVGAVVGFLKATDQNGDLIIFDISSSDTAVKQTFSLGTTQCKNVTEGTKKYSECTCQVILRKEVNFEAVALYILKVYARDTSGSKIFKEFKVNVGDVNEAPSEIKLSGYTVPENKVSVLRILITDPDNLQRPRQSHACTLHNSVNLPFKIEGSNLIVKSDATIDYEAVPSHKYFIAMTCKDDGSPQLGLSRNFVINIKDENEAPTRLALSSAEVEESVKAGHVVGEFSAVDPDTTPQNLVYSIVRPAISAFYIGGKEGRQLIVKTKLDFETRPIIDLTVKVADKGGLSTEKVFVVKVKDVNEPPTDIKLDSQNVTENSPPNWFVTSVEVVDSDKNSSATCKITAPDQQYLYVNPKGLFTTNKRLDYEALLPDPTIRLSLKCTDNGGLSVEKSFSITVKDINEQPTNLTIAARPILENELNAFAGQIHVTDPDRNQKHTCQVLSGGKVHNHFQVNQGNLRISTKDELNFEAFHGYSVLVRCKDQPVESWQSIYEISNSVNFRVVDVNEPPQTPCKETIYVDEASINGSVVHAFMAFDPDNEEYYNAKRAGLLKPNTQPKQQLTFTLVTSSSAVPLVIAGGQYLIATGSVQRGAKYSIQVKVTDDGYLVQHTKDNKLMYTKGAAMSAEFSCSVEVLPSTDPRLAPKIDMTSTTVSENAPNGTVVGEVRILKPKVGETYSFTLMNEGLVPFVLQGSKLAVLNANAINYERVKMFQVGILATDSKGNTRDKTFTIKVTDINEKPTDVCLIGNSIREALPVNTNIGRLVIVDPDQPSTRSICESGKLPTGWSQNYRCSLKPGVDATISGKFAINDKNLIYSKVVFDYSQEKSYALPVVCEDTSKSGFSISKTVKITITSSGCKQNFILSKGKCVCRGGFAGPLCDRDTTICANTICATLEVCVSHYKAIKRCIDVNSQVPVLLRYPYSLVNNKNTVYNLEGFIEEVFERRSTTKTVQDVLSSAGSGTVINRRRREVPKDVYTEAAKVLNVNSQYTYIVFVGMDPSNKYSAISGSELCPLLNGKGLRCVNEEDCKILDQAGIPCPYGSGGLGAKKDQSQKSSPATEPWKYSLIPIAFIALVVIALAGMFVIRRNRRTKAEKARGPFDNSVFVGGGEHVNPVYDVAEGPGFDIPPAELLAPRTGAMPNNLANPIYLQKSSNLQVLSNNLYDTQRNFNNPAYGVSSNHFNVQSESPIYESIGHTAGKKLGKEVVDLPPHSDGQGKPKKQKVALPTTTGNGKETVDLPRQKYSSKPDNRQKTIYSEDEELDFIKKKNQSEA